MAWATLSFESKTLNRPEKIEVLIPQYGFKGQDQKGDFGVVFVLHGLHKDRKEWLLDSQLPFLTRELPLLVVMPSGSNGFYINTANGYHYMDYICRELPAFIKSMFPVSRDPADWTIMGESMGGYGSLVCGFHFPEVFGAVAAFSPVTDILKASENFSDVSFEDLLGSRERASELGFDLFELVRQMDHFPPVRICCGTEDSLLPMNRQFVKVLKEKCPVHYSEGPGGHDFLCWNPEIPAVLSWIMERRNEIRKQEEVKP